MILALDSDEGIIKIGSPPEELPGIVESIEVSDALLIEDADTQGRSGKVKIVQGWDDADLLITLSLLDNPGAGKTRWDYLKQIAGVFKKVADSGKPEVYLLTHPMINAWGVKQLLFSNLRSSEMRTRRKVSLTLEFVEYDPTAGIVQDRQAPAGEAKTADEPVSQTPIVSDQQRRGLGSLEERYAKI
jgi:hypothetical protein